MIYDVVIVGAGPSGSTAAKALAEKHKKVLLVDKESFPRDKPCGGGLPLRTLSRFPYLKTINTIDSYSYGGFVYPPSSNNYVEIIKQEPVLSMVLRSTFDNNLVQLAIRSGVVFQDNKEVINFINDADKIKIFFDDGTTVTSKLLIGADGYHSIIARKLGQAPSKNHKGVCILGEFHLSKNEMDTLFTKNRLSYIHSKFHGIQGYGWVFPKEKDVNIGLVCYNSMKELKKTYGSLKTLFEEYLSCLQDSQVISHKITKKHIKGGILPGSPCSQTYFDKVLLCGDAAGLINPISGEGIYYALVSGQLAGDIAAEALTIGDTSARFLKSYEIKWKRDFGKEINLFLRSKKQWGKRGDKMIERMKKDPVFADMIFSILVGKESAYDLRWKLIKQFIFGTFAHRKKNQDIKIASNDCDQLV